jgi:hypothetical protein
MRESRLQSWMEDSSPRQEPVKPVRSVSQATRHKRAPSNDKNEKARPASALDLRTQMDELKGRISSLRERAQEDRVKRLSNSTMRTPSPFSAAEQWYTDGDAYKNHALSADAGVGWSPNQSPNALHASKEFPLITSIESESKLKPKVSVPHDLQADYAESTYQDAEKTLDDLEEGPLKADEATRRSVGRSTRENTNILEDDEEENDLDGDDQDAESADGRSEYFETVPVLAERHEDRADAFDYENFFLHSAMGSFTRERSGSFSSEESVETTRPVSPNRPATAVQLPQQEELHDQRSPSLHHRSQSYDSISTVASFQTAIEGNDSDSDDEEPDLDRTLATLTPESDTTLSTLTPYSDNTNTSPRQRVNGNAFSHPIPSKDRPLSSLISSFLELDTLSREPSAILEQDRELVGNVVESLKLVCMQLQGHEGADYERRAWRRRLDAARKALDGDYEAQAL